MNATAEHPQIYEINTRPWLRSLSERLGRPLSLGAVPGEVWESLRDLGMDFVWLMGVWRPSEQSSRIALEHPDLAPVYPTVLPDFLPEDVSGSPYAVPDYSLNPLLGDENDLVEVRRNLHKAGLGLILDFVPNHTAPDHPWVRSHPRRYVQSTPPAPFGPGESFSVVCEDGETRAIAHGRDPYFLPWTDTAQLCAFHGDTRRALAEEAARIAETCDGIRFDMAMLPLNAVFSKTWKHWLDQAVVSSPDTEFWEDVLGPVKRGRPECRLIAEVYWDLEYALLDLGFDYACDKTAYDILRGLNAEGYRSHLHAQGPRMRNMIRFLENHDEERMASVFPAEARRAVAVIHAVTPGARLFQDGQLEGFKIRLPLQLAREPRQEQDAGFSGFYRKVLALTNSPVFRQGSGAVLDVLPAAPGAEDFRSLIGFAYREGLRRSVVVVNPGERTATGWLRFPEGFWRGWEEIHLRDRLAEPEETYIRERKRVEDEGLYVKLEPFRFHLMTASL